ncbi:MAG: thioredoxin [Epsilonproteobacteria bacterium]|jgi:thioredoxin 1|nr:thioredoxin [Campylobacterota bacterium]NPA89220.1 thioredoxin [Campylobacterota bacterium]
MALELNRDNFVETIKNNKVVMVDFWAPWCGPCRMIAPVIEELAKEYEGRAVIAKVNTDENQDIAMEFQIRSIPTVLFFKNGELVDGLIGAAPKNMYQEKLEKLLAD